MPTLSPKSRMGAYYLEAYEKSTWSNLNQAYRKPSDRKRAAFRACLDIMKMEDGHSLKVISAGCQMFSVAFKRPDGSLQVITALNTYIIK